tara:strand:+ start:309 stop:611 length:303 start_codon:yes stop_codon:yes gene_type:complete
MKTRLTHTDDLKIRLQKCKEMVSHLMQGEVNQLQSAMNQGLLDDHEWVPGEDYVTREKAEMYAEAHDSGQTDPWFLEQLAQYEDQEAQGVVKGHGWWRRI